MTIFGSQLFILLLALCLWQAPALAEDDPPLEANTPTYKAGDAAPQPIKRSKPFKTKKKNTVSAKKKSKKKAAKKKILKPKWKAKPTAANEEELPAPMPKKAK